ncbi:uncharacterized mitochondrial protein AtMg00810-like [Lathyrus oleraceus]|uniref:uncharacterized mitochondrial protein AtMg00810-like n=1 Tax=Pisum sativum TaxID=3888 RepID=UPI0021D0D667|nr:uncharacterized mitochondrial protein AtMg00810-like [Pisum sativum]
MLDLDNLSYFLGMDFLYKEGGIILHQTKYATNLLKRFNMLNYNVVVTPVESGQKLKEDNDEESVEVVMYNQMIESLRYLCNSRPYINYVVRGLHIFMHDPRNSHMLYTKKVLRSIKGTLRHIVFFSYGRKRSKEEVIGFSDSD